MIILATEINQPSIIDMKKIAVFLVSIFILSLVTSSCVSNKKCAAYGETNQYQKDK